jgi:hypothetical protein
MILTKTARKSSFFFKLIHPHFGFRHRGYHKENSIQKKDLDFGEPGGGKAKPYLEVTEYGPTFSL